jgi:hypothetical protein
MQVSTTTELPADAKQQIDRLREIFGDPNEELVPELKARYFTNGPLPYINHPFVCIPAHFAGQHGMANRMLEKKRAAFDEAVADGKWEAAIDCYIEKPFRMEYLLKYQDRIPDDQYWRLLHDVWTGIENPWQYKRQIQRLFKGRKGVVRECFRDEKDWEYFQSLPDIIEIYRGCTVLNRSGWSWTLSKAKARWFSRRFNDVYDREVNGIVINRTIRKDIAHFYTNCRNEQEIVVNPRLLSL